MSIQAGDVRVGVDIGGTFTDIAVQIGPRFVTAKVLTMPRAPEQAVMQGIAAALAEAVIDSARLGIDVGAVSALERYQRWRRFDTMAMGVATDALNRLFSNRSDVLRFTRDVGLGLVDRLPALKHFFIREAAGLVGEVPKLLKGEAL